MSGGQAVCATCGAVSPPLTQARDGRRWLHRHYRKRHGFTPTGVMAPVYVPPESPVAEYVLNPRRWEP